MYVADIRPLYDKSIYDMWWQKMPKYRKDRALRYRMEADRIRSVAAMALLIKAYEDYVRIESIDSETILPEICIGQNGKPYFDESSIYFNLSHSGERVVCVFSDAPVGCDVEYKNDGALKIAKRFFTENEYRIIADVTDELERNRLFDKVWTLKESVVKMMGDGLTFPINEFEVIDDEANVKKSITIEKYSQTMYLQAYSHYDNYGYACCCLNGDFAEEIISVSLDS